MKKSLTAFSLLAIGASLCLTACGGDATNQNDELNVVDTTEMNTDDELADLFESPDLDYHLPSPLQVASIFKKSGLEYNSDATSSVDKASDYTSELKQMLNFGVYSADMAYCVLNMQSNEARKYLNVISDLAERIGMEAVFENADLMDRFDENMDNRDSTEMLMIDIQERTEEYMDENDMQHQQAIHFAGAWVEGMYLGVYDFENNPSKDGVGMQITEQMAILENIIAGLGDPKNDGMDIEWLITDLNEIQDKFDGFESVKSYFADPTADELILRNEEYDALGGLIKTLRTKITSA